MKRRAFLASLSASVFTPAAAPLVRTVAQVLPKAALRPTSNVGLIGHIDVGKVKMSKEMLRYLQR
jgi:hypothetical protein